MNVSLIDIGHTHLHIHRYQSIPLFSTEDANNRHRMLKYTPEHMHCYATFYGPSIPPNTGKKINTHIQSNRSCTSLYPHYHVLGILAYQNLSNHSPYFRVAATGIVIDFSFYLFRCSQWSLTCGFFYSSRYCGGG